MKLCGHQETLDGLTKMHRGEELGTAHVLLWSDWRSEQGQGHSLVGLRGFLTSCQVCKLWEGEGAVSGRCLWDH